MNNAVWVARTDLSALVNAWVLSATVFDGTQTGDANRFKVYINGSPVVLTWPFPGVEATTPNMAGASLISGSASLAQNYYLSEKQIYNSVLSAGFNTTLYNAFYTSGAVTVGVWVPVPATSSTPSSAGTFANPAFAGSAFRKKIFRGGAFR
jgi:hypothetical protein